MAKSIQEMNWWRRRLYRWGIIDSEGKLALVRLPMWAARLVAPIIDRFVDEDVRVTKNPLFLDISLDLVRPNKDKVSTDRVLYWVEKMKKDKDYPSIMITSDNVIVDGHARFLARIKLGYTTIAAIRLNDKDSAFVMAGGVLRIQMERQ